MTILKELQELEARHYIVGILTALLLVGPGILCIFVYRPDLILALDVFKLVVVSGSLALPPAVVNFLFVVAAWAPERTDGPAADAVWAVTSAVTTFVLYLALYLAFIFGQPFRNFTFIALCLELLVVVVCLILFRKREAQTKKAQ